jgi:hypothetical protein
MDKKLPIFHPGIPATVSIVIAVITALLCANWLDNIMKL